MINNDNSVQFPGWMTSLVVMPYSQFGQLAQVNARSHDKITDGPTLKILHRKEKNRWLRDRLASALGAEGRLQGSIQDSDL